MSSALPCFGASEGGVHRLYWSISLGVVVFLHNVFNHQYLGRVTQTLIYKGGCLPRRLHDYALALKRPGLAVFTCRSRLRSRSIFTSGQRLLLHFQLSNASKTTGSTATSTHRLIQFIGVNQLIRLKPNSTMARSSSSSSFAPEEDVAASSHSESSVAATQPPVMSKTHAPSLATPKQAIGKAFKGIQAAGSTKHVSKGNSRVFATKRGHRLGATLANGRNQ